MIEIGDVLLSPALTLNKVLFVPSFKFNLIFVNCLSLQLNGIVTFNKSSCLLKGPSLESPLELGRAKNCLYFLCHKCHNFSTSSAQNNSHVPCHHVPSVTNVHRKKNTNVCTTSFVKSPSFIKKFPLLLTPILVLLILVPHLLILPTILMVVNYCGMLD